MKGGGVGGRGPLPQRLIEVSEVFSFSSCAMAVAPMSPIPLSVWLELEEKTTYKKC
jgi:hypothetical protein